MSQFLRGVWRTVSTLVQCYRCICRLQPFPPRAIVFQWRFKQLKVCSAWYLTWIRKRKNNLSHLKIENLNFCCYCLNYRVYISKFSQINMYDKGSRPLNWHLWHDTNPEILSSPCLVWQSFVGGLSAFCLCSIDFVGTPPDCGVVYPCDSFKTLRWGIFSKLEKR